MDGLTIIVRGRRDHGRTTTARILEEALKEAGYTAVRVIDLPPSPDDKDRWWNRFQRTRERPINIVIETIE